MGIIIISKLEETDEMYLGIGLFSNVEMGMSFFFTYFPNHLVLLVSKQPLAQYVDIVVNGSRLVRI